MDVLHLVPVTLLVFVCIWLWGALVIDPIARYFKSMQRRNLGDADEIAETLFGIWSQRCFKTDLITLDSPNQDSAT